MTDMTATVEAECEHDAKIKIVTQEVEGKSKVSSKVADIEIEELKP